MTGIISLSNEHNIDQLGGKKSFPVKKNGNFSFLKILNPWIIKTPPGYSCLFIPPVLNENDYFSIIPAIVDTDKFSHFVNFPIIINADKYPKFDMMFKQGTPYVQVIPFKRENWKMKIKSKKTKDIVKEGFGFSLKFLHRYKNLNWHKKSWK